MKTTNTIGFERFEEDFYANPLTAFIPGGSKDVYSKAVWPERKNVNSRLIIGDSEIEHPDTDIKKE